MKKRFDELRDGKDFAEGVIGFLRGLFDDFVGGSREKERDARLEGVAHLVPPLPVTVANAHGAPLAVEARVIAFTDTFLVATVIEHAYYKDGLPLRFYRRTGACADGPYRLYQDPALDVIRERLRKLEGRAATSP